AAPAALEWSSANPAVATVGKIDGVVTAISVGSTAVTVTAGALSATMAVSVLNQVAGIIAFTRVSWGAQLNGGAFRAIPQALSYSFVDRTTRPLAGTTCAAAPAWSPDGALLAVEVIKDAFGDPNEGWIEYTSDVYVLSATDPLGLPWRALTTGGDSRSPSWSPDGSRIAYVRGAMASKQKDIYLVSVGGGAATRLTPTAGEYSTPRWSPDGT